MSSKNRRLAFKTSCEKINSGSSLNIFYFDVCKKNILGERIQGLQKIDRSNVT